MEPRTGAGRGREYSSTGPRVSGPRAPGDTRGRGLRAWARRGARDSRARGGPWRPGRSRPNTPGTRAIRPHRQEPRRSRLSRTPSSPRPLANARGKFPRRAQRGRVERVASGRLRGEATRDQVLVRRAPHRARGLLLAPASRADRAVSPVVGLVGAEHRTPALRQARQLRPRDGQQRRSIGPRGQFGEHVQSLPDGTAQDLAEYLVHLNVTVTFPPARRLL